MTPQALHKQRLKARGCCVRCSQPNDRVPFTRCTVCAERECAQMRARREYLIARGLCHVCRTPSQGFTRCRRCRVAHANGDKRRATPCQSLDESMVKYPHALHGKAQTVTR